MVWAVMFAGLILFAWRIWAHHGVYTWNEWPTGLGDRDYYESLTSNDFYSAGLSFHGHEKGLFRRSGVPLVRDDAKMSRLDRDGSNRVWVYTDAARPMKKFYLKAGEDRYVEFGVRKFWPEYQPPKALPVR